MHKNTGILISLVILSLFIGCDTGGSVELASKYIGIWIAQSYDVEGTLNDYTLADLTMNVNENKTYRFIISQDTFTQYNKYGTLKIKCDIDPDTESSFDFTVVDPGIETMALGATAYYDIIETASGGLVLNAYWDSTKASGIIATYELLPE